MSTCRKKRSSCARCKRRKSAKSAIAVRFIDKCIRGLAVTDDPLLLPAQNTSRLTVYSYAIVNRGKEPVRVRVDVGPNLTNYASDREMQVPAGQTVVLVPTRFLKYTRIVLQAHEDHDAAVRCDVYFQAQTMVYRP
ncbi:DUF6385 domain-containing protein [Paenibacillus methanolicus]|uniref:DUF6385 domain-containing protein n=1 Tax=Paenibacillus methanolicus TaxID=582686 RepID=A0A5S5CNF4_9BACL|nr:DUF6385 domain-containing protein [Paenibacillus methanolicus]TYP79878.1 hypothetical protein BCM02_101999 [Paenibacillus methanolicus]